MKDMKMKEEDKMKVMEHMQALGGIAKKYGMQAMEMVEMHMKPEEEGMEMESDESEEMPDKESKKALIVAMLKKKNGISSDEAY